MPEQGGGGKSREMSVVQARGRWLADQPVVQGRQTQAPGAADASRKNRLSKRVSSDIESRKSAALIN